MKAIKHLYLHFIDGQRLALRFPQQHDDPVEIVRGIRKQLDSPYLSIEVDGDLLLIPRDSIKYLQITPAPMSLPDITVVGAELID
ncbi:hypothetical protein [Pseudomonas panipatensis]|uniref:Uncharacterized protein n=1 Tax=Pseudomonas panipatensis TaxID=428992 RepID=A0A1G8J893_9PSED|nr:hypothetical protein [Pseudomonas panipatensis]SDI26860.1 hypothetical protein SAMN05216272_107188 [Pseudomonas panipatensis]SMP49741.1 hypothetical protein SAMN06295951_102421 [Pseudomonas panipatensis]